MVDEREIFGGKELMDFFCKDAVEGNIDRKEFCSFIIIFARKPTSLQLVGGIANSLILLIYIIFYKKIYNIL